MANQWLDTVITGTLQVSGAVTLQSTLGVTGAVTASSASNAIRIGTSCDMTTPPAIGGTTRNTGRFSSLNVDSGGAADLIVAAITDSYDSIQFRDANMRIGKNGTQMRLQAASFLLYGPMTLGGVSTDLINHTGRLIPRNVTDAGPMTATGGTAGEIVWNTSNSKHYGCTVTHTSAATWSALY